MFKKYLKSIDYSIIIVCTALFVIGVIALYSANGGLEGDISETIKQVIWFFVGFLCMALIIFIDHEIIRKIMADSIRIVNNITDSSVIYRTYKWCYKLVFLWWHKLSTK